MKIDIAKEFLRNILRSEEHIPVMLWSGPGIGKSSINQQLAEELKLNLVDLRLSLLNPVDLRGLPIVDKEKKVSRWLPPAFLPPSDSTEPWLLFLDEINLAPASVMHAGYQLIHDRRLGEYTLPKSCKVVAAGNRMQDNANITKFPSPLANRFCHIEIEPDVEAWRPWAIRKQINERIIAFVSHFPQHFYVDPKAGDMAFPTPRSWENSSKLLKIGNNIETSVGKGVAAEFNAYEKVYMKLPDIDKVLAGKEKNVPEGMDVRWALCISIAIRCKKQHIDNVFGYIEGLPSEFKVITIKNIGAQSEEMRRNVIDSNGWAGFRKKHGDILNAPTLLSAKG